MKRILDRYLGISGWLLMLATWLPLLRVHIRWIRILDFPRLQLAAWCLFNLGLTGLLSGSPRKRVFRSALAGACFLRHAWKLLPFTRLKGKESPSAPADYDRADAAGLLVSNVLMSNRNAEGLLERVRKENPDLMLFLETDQWWSDRLHGLDREYPWHVKVPQSNTYGMSLYSRFPLSQVRVDRRLHPEVPSVHAVVRMPSGRCFRLFCVHPRPPVEEPTDDRDAELYLVGKEAVRSDLPCVVAGDLNDVAWSRTTRLFQEVSGTLDPRVGRGFFNTYHASYPLLRYSLDHVFHTREFTVIELRRLESFGSDHFPIFIRLCLNPFDEAGERPPPPDTEERERVAETVRTAEGAEN